VPKSYYLFLEIVPKIRFLISIPTVSTIVPALITSRLETTSNPIHPLFMHFFDKLLLTTYFTGNCSTLTVVSGNQQWLEEALVPGNMKNTVQTAL